MNSKMAVVAVGPSLSTVVLFLLYPRSPVFGTPLFHFWYTLVPVVVPSERLPSWKPPFCEPQKNRVKTFRGATEPSQPDLPLWTRPPPNPSFRTRFRPDFDPILTRFQARIRSKSGLIRVRNEGFGGGRVQRGRSAWEGSVCSSSGKSRRIGEK